MAQGEERLLEIVRCAVCLEVVVDPKTNTCGHTFCGLCLQACEETGLCPGCRAPLHPEIGVNIMLRELVQHLFPEPGAAPSPAITQEAALPEDSDSNAESEEYHWFFHGKVYTHQFVNAETMQTWLWNEHTGDWIFEKVDDRATPFYVSEGPPEDDPPYHWFFHGKVYTHQFANTETGQTWLWNENTDEWIYEEEDDRGTPFFVADGPPRR